MVLAGFDICGSLEVLLRCFEAARQKDLDQAARREKDPPLQSSDVKSFDAVSIQAVYQWFWLLTVQDKKTKEGEKMVPVKLRMSGLKPTTQNNQEISSWSRCAAWCFLFFSRPSFSTIYKYCKLFVIILTLLCYILCGFSDVGLKAVQVNSHWR